MNATFESHEALRQLLGAYILGGLDRAEEEIFEQHLAVCPDCAAELDGLRTLPALLAAVPAIDAVALTPARPDKSAQTTTAALDAVQPLLVKLAVRRRRARLRVAAFVSGIAAACLAIGFLLGPVFNQPAKPDETYTIAAASGLQVDLGLMKKAWGTELALDGKSLPSQGVLSIWVKDKVGNYDRAASWNAIPQGRARITGATPVKIENMVSVEIRDGGQTIAVVSMPAAGG